MFFVYIFLFFVILFLFINLFTYYLNIISVLFVVLLPQSEIIMVYVFNVVFTCLYSEFSSENDQLQTETHRIQQGEFTLLCYYFTINLKNIFFFNICSYYSTPIIDACL